MVHTGCAGSMGHRMSTVKTGLSLDLQAQHWDPMTQYTSVLPKVFMAPVRMLLLRRFGQVTHTILVTIGLGNDLFSAKPLRIELGQFNCKIGISAQFKFQNWTWNWNWWIENGIGNTCIGIGIENYVTGIEILQLLLHQFIVNQSHSKKERRSLSFMWLTHHATGVSDF